MSEAEKPPGASIELSQAELNPPEEGGQLGGAGAASLSPGSAMLTSDG
jgi:hypothetical protein